MLLGIVIKTKDRAFRQLTRSEQLLTELHLAEVCLILLYLR